MQDKNLHLRSVLLPPDASPPHPGESDGGLPTLRDGEYQPFARPSNRPIQAIHFLSPSGEVRTFQYAHLDSDARFAAERITLRFVGMEPTTVLVEGRNLWRLYDYIHQHRMPWAMVAARDFAKDGEPIVTGVSFAACNDTT